VTPAPVRILRMSKNDRPEGVDTLGSEPVYNDLTGISRLRIAALASLAGMDSWTPSIRAGLIWPQERA